MKERVLSLIVLNVALMGNTRNFVTDIYRIVKKIFVLHILRIIIKLNIKVRKNEIEIKNNKKIHIFACF